VQATIVTALLSCNLLEVFSQKASSKTLAMKGSRTEFAILQHSTGQLSPLLQAETLQSSKLPYLLKSIALYVKKMFT